MGLSRLEVNFRRLLTKCELMIKNKQLDDPRFPKYIESLLDMLNDLQNDPDVTAVDDYSRRISVLKQKMSVSSKKENDLAENKDLEMNDTSVSDGKNLSAREELLGENKLRKRPAKGTEDLDEILEYHTLMQDKIADEMLILTRNLKEQSQLANKIIKQDTDVVSKSSHLSEKNFSNLKNESEKLAEHSKRACKCWMWIMLVIVMVVFINMVLFMKVMKKRV